MSHSELCRLALDAWNGPILDSNTPPRRNIVLSPSSSWCGGTRPSSSHAVPQEIVSEGEFCASLHTVVMVGELAVECDAKVNR